MGRTISCDACLKIEAVFPFTMAFQPIIDLQLGEIYGHEALVRGISGEGAASILSQVDDTNIYAFDQACRTKAIGLAAKLGLDRPLSINFLPNAIYDPKACLRHTLSAASRYRFPHHLLTFEIVETEKLAETAHLAAIVAEYRSHGFKTALDDFGTGFSGLARLADLKPDILKVDRALVANCDRDAVRLSIIASILSLGQTIGTMIVLEGVETHAEVEALRAIGGRFMQGYYFARPLLEKLATNGDVNWPPTPNVAQRRQRFAEVEKEGLLF